MLRIAIYHCSIKIISRGTGRTAVGAAAYRSGERLESNYDGLIHDYTRKRGVIYKEILLPVQAPEEFKNREVLWNSVEKIEKSKNAQLAREIEVAIPRELPPDKRIELVQEYCRQNFTAVGMCADICIHEPDKKDGEENPHAHIMLTMRPIAEDGSWGAKSKKEYLLDKDGQKIYDKKKRQYKCRKVNSTDWNNREKAEEWRRKWADISNQYLQAENISERIDHRSYVRQGIELIPTVHLGVDAAQMERRGFHTDLGDINRSIKSNNDLLARIRARLYELSADLKALLNSYYKALNAREETNANIEYLVQGIVQSKGIVVKHQGYDNGINQKLYDLKNYAEAFTFIEENGIDVYEKLEVLYRDANRKRNALIKQSRLLNEKTKGLEELLKQAGNYRKYKVIHNKLETVWNKNKFADDYRMELELFNHAKRYLDTHLGVGGKLKSSKWEEDLQQLQADKITLDKKYKEAKREVARVSGVRAQVEKLISDYRGANVRYIQNSKTTDIEH